MADPTFGANEQDPNVQASIGGTPETNPNDKGYMWAAQKYPGMWEFRNGQWAHREGVNAPWQGTVDARKPGGEGTVGGWLEGIFSGDRTLMGTDSAQGLAKKKAAADAAAAQGQQDSISARMQAFIDSMLGPMDANDPVYQGLMQAGLDAAQKHSGQAGLAGRSTLAGTQAASVAQQNVQPWMAARLGAGQQMLTSLSGRDISLGNLALGQQQVNQGLAESQSNAAKNTMGTIGSVGGGIIGGIYGGPGGAAAGSSIGGGVLGSLGGGGASGPGYTPNTWRPGGSYKPSGSGY